MQFASGIGLVKMGTLAIDGTKIKANASKRKARTILADGGYGSENNFQQLESRTRVHVGLHGAESAEVVHDDGVEVVNFVLRVVESPSF